MSGSFGEVSVLAKHRLGAITQQMKTASFLIFSALLFTASFADEPKKIEAEPTEKALPTKQVIEGWGVALDFVGDCTFQATDGKLTVKVAGSPKPHDLSTELLSSTAPRIVQPLNGDFVIQVKIDGEFAPGDDSSQLGRTGYTGAGLVVFADAKNYVRLERATLHRSSGDEPAPYTNFEIRVDGELERIGNTGDLPTVAGKPTWLRLERKGNFLHGSMSQDGKTWTSGAPKELSAAAWKEGRIFGGLAAISTSKKDFTPTYSEFSVQHETEKKDAK